MWLGDTAEIADAGRGAAIKFFWEVFVTLLVITDPAGIVPLFIALGRGREPRERHRLAWQAALVAFGVILAFALFGREVLTYLGVELPALQGAGGLLLLLVALELLTGKASELTEAECEQINVAFVPLGTPLLAARARSWRACCSSSGSIMGHRWPLSGSPCAP